MLKKKLACLIAALVITVLVSASSWEGSAMMGSYGDFPPSGYYAASNSFPRNSSIQIENLENGRTVNLIITKGLDAPGIFIMLSVEAASAIGLSPGKIVRVRASSPKSPIELAPVGASSSFDPDLNPKQLAAQELKRLGYDLKPDTSTEIPAIKEKPSVSEQRIDAKDSTTSNVLPVLPELAEKPAEKAEPKIITPIAKESPKELKAEETKALTEEPSVISAISDPQKADQIVAPSKLKPIRTIILPQLPEPELYEITKKPDDSSLVKAETAESQKNEAYKPEVHAGFLPIPDETPIRVDSSISPKRYDAPTIRPEVIDYIAAALPQGVVYSTLEEPVFMEETLAKAELIGRDVPDLKESKVLAEMAWPELEADEIPEVVIAGLKEPKTEIPYTSLAEGEIILKDQEGPKAVALESPQFEAAETQVALADAKEQKPEVSVYKEWPKDSVPDVSPDYEITLEPAASKPPATTAHTIAPAADKVSPKAEAEKSMAITADSKEHSYTQYKLVSELEKGRYYIQLGAYASKIASIENASRLGAKYPTLIQSAVSSGKESWKLFVGPLSRDESGVMLVKIRALGFKDAFVKSNN